MRTLVIRLLVFLALAGSANAQTTYNFNFSEGGTGSFVYDDVAMTANAISFDFGALGSIAPYGFNSQTTALVFGTPPTAAIRQDGTFFGATLVAGTPTATVRLYTNGTYCLRPYPEPWPDYCLVSGTYQIAPAVLPPPPTYTIVADLSTIGGGPALGGLVAAGDGHLYGTTYGGGANGCGLVYRLTLGGEVVKVHDFLSAQGCRPVGDLAIGNDGALYGTTYQGGASGLGTVFRIALDGTFTLLHSFVGYPYGGQPNAGLTLHPSGLLYGIATDGTFFSISTAGVFTRILNNSSLLWNAQAALTLGSDGFFYGTMRGETFNYGRIFRLDTAGALTVLHSFPHVIGGDPEFPQGALPLSELVEAPDGTFYGTTSVGGPASGDRGTIFKMTAGVVTVIYAFSETAPGVYGNGETPSAGLTLGTDGLLYGMATLGGATNNGTLFRIAPDGTGFTLLRSFDAAEGGGSQEDSLLELTPGTFYGVTAQGKIFRLTTVANATPVAQNLAVAATEDQTASGILPATDANSDPLTFSVVSNGALGVANVTDPATGAFTYTPAPNAHGVDTFTFKANDGHSDSNIATVTVTIAAINDAPVAVNGTLTTNEDSPATDALSATDIDGPSLTFSIVTNGTLGTAVVTNPATGVFTYTPNANAFGTDSITFEANDGTSDSNVATVTVTIENVNDAPVAVNGTLSVTEDLAATGTLAASDPDGDSLTYTIVGNGGKGKARITDPATGAFTFTPSHNASGVDTFTFATTDGALQSNVASVTVTIIPVNDAPAAHGQSLTMLEDTTKDIVLAGLDADGDVLTFSIVSQPSQGTLTGAGPDVTYSPNPNFNGSDSFSYRVTDQHSNSNVATVTISVRSAIWSESSGLGGRVTAIVVHPLFPSVVYAGGFDTGAWKSIDGGATWTSSSSGIVDQRVTSFVVDPNTPSTLYASTLSGVVRSIDGGASWTPSISSQGINALAYDAGSNILYAASCCTGVMKSINGGLTWTTSSTGLTSLSVQHLAIDPETRSTIYAATQAGVFKSIDSGASWSDTPISSPARLVLPDPAMPGTVYAIASSTMFKSTNAGASWTSVSGLPFNGVSTLAIDPAGSAVYAGTINGVFKSSNGGASWLLATGAIPQGSVSAIALDPTSPTTIYASLSSGLFRSTDAGASWFLRSSGLAGPWITAIAATSPTSSTQYAATAFGGITSLDGGVTWTERWSSGPTGASALAVDPATPTTVYAAISGVPSLYKSIDGGATWMLSQSGLGGQGVGALAIDQAVTTTIYAATSGAGVFKSVDGAANWSDSSSGLTHLFVSGLVLDPLTPTTLYAATGVGVFKTTDGGGTWTPSALTASIQAIAIDPISPSILYAASFRDIYKSSDGGVTWTAAIRVTNNVVTHLAVDPRNPSRLYAGTQNDYVYRSTNAGASWVQVATGLTGVRVTALAATSRAYVGTFGGLFTLHEAANDAALANDQNVTTAESSPKQILLTASDPDGDSLTYLVVTPPGHGQLSGSAPNLTYTPAAGYSGPDSFTFKVNDGQADSNVATVSITVSAVNEAPVAQPLSITTSEDTAVSATLPATDPDGDVLTFTIATNGTLGTATITNVSTGAFIYTPNPDAFGNDTFTFQVSDGTVASNVATVTVTITEDPLTVTVTTPNGGEKVFANVPFTIRWTPGGAATSFDVALSRNSGGTYTAIAGCTGLAGTATSCTWTPTGSGTSAARIRVTARSATGTTVSDASDADFTIATATPSITVTSPNTAVSWAVGSARNITWNHNLGLGSRVRLELTRNDGGAWETIAPSVLNTTATSGIHPWVVLGPPLTSSARVRVTSLDTPAADISNALFSIVAPVVTVTAPNTNVNWEIGQSRNVTWTHNLGNAEAVRVEVSRDGGTTWATLSSAVQNQSDTTGSFNWVVTGPVTSTARIRIAWSDDGNVQDVGDVNFRVSSRITVTAPNSTVTWGAGSTRTVTWSHNYGTGQTFDIAFSADAGASWIPVASTVPAATATTGTYTGPLPATVTSQALIRVSPAGNAGDGDVSNVTFTLAAPTLTVTAPDTNVAWTVGSIRTIRWSHNLGQAEQVTIDVSRDGGTTWTTIATPVTNTNNGTGSFNWTVTGPPTNTARIRVSWTANVSVQDMSNVNFRIQ